MKNNNKTAAALVELLKGNGIESKTTHTSPSIKRHLILLTSKADMEKALALAKTNGFPDAYEAGKDGKISIPNPAFKEVAKRVSSKKTASKKAVEKPSSKPASKKNAPKFKGKVGPKKKISAMFIEGGALLSLIEGITIPNLETLLTVYLKKKDPAVRRSILKKVGQAVGVPIERGLTAEVQKKLEKLERIEKAVGSRKKS